MSKDFVDDRDRLERLIAGSRRRVAELDVKLEVGDNLSKICREGLPHGNSPQ